MLRHNTTIMNNGMTQEKTEIYLLCRCIERKYAEMLFDDGILHFSYPKKWIDEAKKGNVGQGDLLEGVYSNEVKFKNLFIRKSPRAVRDEIGKWYLRSNSVVKNWPCVCFYCASGQSPHTDEGDTRIIDMSKKYAEEFSSDETAETMFAKQLAERKAMVVIKKPEVFFEKIRIAFAKEDLEEGVDYFMDLVEYRAKDEQFTYRDVPEELFHKDEEFEHQQEYRITLNPNSIKVRRMLNGGEDVKIGSLKDCAMLKSHFYNGALVKVNGKMVQLELREWYNMSGPLHELEFDYLFLIFGMAIYSDTRYVVGGREIDGIEMKEIVKKVMYDKYQVRMLDTWDQIGSTLYLDPIPEKDCIATIRKNEGMDTFHYLRGKAGYEAPSFEKLLKWNPEKNKRDEFSCLMYSSSDDKAEASISWNYKD